MIYPDYNTSTARIPPTKPYNSARFINISTILVICGIHCLEHQVFTECQDENPNVRIPLRSAIAPLGHFTAHIPQLKQFSS